MGAQGCTRWCTAGGVAGGWLAAVLLLLLAACSPREDEVPPEVDLADHPDQETWDVDLALSMEGRPRARVVAPYLARYDGPDSTYALFRAPEGDTTRIRVTVYDEDGARSGTVTSDRLFYFDDERRFVAEGRVVVETVEAKTLHGERLVWDEAARELRSDGFVRITTPQEQIQGYRLVAEEDLETYSLARITGQVTVEE